MESFNWLKASEQKWDHQADSWNASSKDMWESGSRKDIVPFFTKYVMEGAKVCDLGCGDGYGSFKLALAGYNVVGVDVSNEMIEKARELTKETTAIFQKGDISKLNVSDDCFNAAIAINSLEWTQSPLDVLIEMKRIVKNDGLICIGLLGPTAAPRINSYRRLYGEEVVCNTMMPWELEKLAEENGLIKVDELGVYKRGVENINVQLLSNELRQALTFMWLFMFKNKK